MNQWEMFLFSRDIVASCRYKAGQLAVSKNYFFYVVQNTVQQTKNIEFCQDIYSWWPFLQNINERIFAGVEYKDSKYHLAELFFEQGTFSIIRRVHNYDIIGNGKFLYLKDPLNLNLLKVGINNLLSEEFRFSKTRAGWAISFEDIQYYEEYDDDSRIYQIDDEKLTATQCQWIYAQSAGAFKTLLNLKFVWVQINTLQEILEEPYSQFILTPFGLSRFRKANQTLQLQHLLNIQRINCQVRSNNITFMIKYWSFQRHYIRNRRFGLQLMKDIAQFGIQLDFSKFAGQYVYSALTPFKFKNFGELLENYADVFFGYQFKSKRLWFSCFDID